MVSAAPQRTLVSLLFAGKKQVTLVMEWLLSHAPARCDCSNPQRVISHRKRGLTGPSSMPHMKNPARISRAGRNRLAHKKGRSRAGPGSAHSSSVSIS